MLMMLNSWYRLMKLIDFMIRFVFMIFNATNQRLNKFKGNFL